MIFGGFLMVFWYLAGNKAFFARKPETADPEILHASGATPGGA